MKLEIICRTNKLPNFYQNRFYSLIQREIDKVKDIEVKKKLKTTLFSFAFLFDKFEIKKGDIKINHDLQIEDDIYFLEGKQRFIIRSCNEFLLEYLNLVFTHLDTFDFSEYNLFTCNSQKVFIKFLKSEIIKENEITKNKIKLKTLSSIILTDSKHSEVSIFDNLDYYNEIFNKRCSLKIQAIKKRDLFLPLKITPVEIEKTKTKHLFKTEMLVFNGFKGSFILEGNYKDLDLLFRVGLGNRNSQGFGMVDYE